MPRIFDNMTLTLVSALRDNLSAARRLDVSVGYFNLRGWRLIDSLIEELPGEEGSCCRLIVGMQRSPQEELRRALSLSNNGERLSNKEVNRLIRLATEEFREQLQIGAPTDADEAGLRRLSDQLRAKKLRVKLHLRHPLHAKLYLVHRDDSNLPTVGFVGSSNLTPSGLRHQGELNVDVLDHDSTDKLTRWFEDRWRDRWCVDISDKLALYISRNGDYSQSKAIFDALAADKEDIDSAFGGDLEWERMDNAITSKIVKYIDVGGYADESKWAAVQDAMIDAMVRLERAVSPYIRKLEV